MRVAAVAQPSVRARKGGQAQQQQPRASGDAKQGDAAGAKQRRAAQYSTWQAMAQHASSTTTSATTSGFDESMM